MKLIYKGKYKSLADLPVRAHPAGAVPFREAEDMKKLGLVLNGAALVLTVLLGAVFVWRGLPYFRGRLMELWLGMMCPMLLLFPHELLHALCFRDEVELYTNRKQGMLFVVGLEDMSKRRFVFMSLLPNVLFGLLPFLLFLLQPHWIFLGALGAIALPMGAGDYYNVYNCLTQVPKGALVYLSGMHSYWYIPEVDHGKVQ